VTPTRVPKQLAWLRRRRHDLDPEAGQVTTEYLAWGAIIVGIIVVIGAALQALGTDVIGAIRDAIT
jgi:hypothetical protein